MTTPTLHHDTRSPTTNSTHELANCPDARSTTTESESEVRPKERPAKPRPDYPIFAHANGQWAKKIQGRLHYFGSWDDPEEAEKAYQAYVDGEFTRPAEDGKTTEGAQRPKKPRKGFPLWPHPVGQWAKKNSGVTHDDYDQM